MEDKIGTKLFLAILGIILFPILTILFILGATYGVYANDENVFENEEEVIDSGFQLPFDDKVIFAITSPYGKRVDPLTNVSNTNHRGVDISVPIGTNILASANGVVSVVGYSSTGLGNYVYISHHIEEKIYIAVYAHMKDDSIVVEEGQVIHAKDKIGVVGNTGRVFPQPSKNNPNAGTHLHFELHNTLRKLDGTTELDPTYIFKKKDN